MFPGQKPTQLEPGSIAIAIVMIAIVKIIVIVIVIVVIMLVMVIPIAIVILIVIEIVNCAWLASDSHSGLRTSLMATTMTLAPVSQIEAFVTVESPEGTDASGRFLLLQLYYYYFHYYYCYYSSYC